MTLDGFGPWTRQIILQQICRAMRSVHRAAVLATPCLQADPEQCLGFKQPRKVLASSTMASRTHHHLRLFLGFGCFQFFCQLQDTRTIDLTYQKGFCVVFNVGTYLPCDRDICSPFCSTGVRSSWPLLI